MVIYFHIHILQYGCTPLFEASQNGHDKIVDLLIAAKADVNIANKVSYLHACIDVKLQY